MGGACNTDPQAFVDTLLTCSFAYRTNKALLTSGGRRAYEVEDTSI